MATVVLKGLLDGYARAQQFSYEPRNSIRRPRATRVPVTPTTKASGKMPVNELSGEIAAGDPSDCAVAVDEATAHPESFAGWQ